MSKGYDKNRKRLEELSLLTKDLVRRASSSCELCSVSGVSLHVFEVGPIDDEIDYEKCILICETCYEQIEDSKKMDITRWKFLNNAVWSSVPPVQVISVRLLKKFAKEESWAQELLDQVYIDPEIQSWIDMEG